MKPSERIKELYQEQVKLKPELEGVKLMTWAIAEYLDEEYEKNKPCEHELGNVSINGMRECKKCHILTS